MNKVNCSILCLFFLCLFSTKISTQTTYFLSSISGSNNNDGLSTLSPWKTLDKINNTPLFPGDKIMFCSGQTFTGTLVIDGSGTEMDPIIIDIYGGSDRAVINGENNLCCIYLDNKQGIEIHNLELINDGGTNPNVNATQKRLGIYATAYWGIKKHLVFKNLYIHSIYPNNYQSSSEQILYAGTGIEITGFGGNTSRFDDILIEDCEITDVGNVGIIISRWINASNPPPPENTHHKNILIKDNFIHHTGGSGAVFFNVKNFLIEDNIFTWTGYHDSLVEPRQHGTGSCWWGVRCKNGILQKNEFSHVRGAADSHGAHIDIACDSVIIQYNYSFDNEGGFAEYMGSSTNCIYRYNLSINDGWRVKNMPCSNGVTDTAGVPLNNRQHGTTIWFSDFTGFQNQPKVGASNNKVYNNTIYVPPGISPRIKFEDSTHHNEIFNNLFFIDSSSSIIYDASPSAFNNEFDYNFWYGTVDATIPFGINSISGINPNLNNVGSSNAEDYRIDNLSPLFNTGRLIANNGNNDYFGGIIPSFGIPDIGFHEFQESLSTENQLDSYLISLPFPNPVDQYLYINDALKNKYFELYNLMGELVFSGKLKNELFLGNLKSGTYYLNLTELKKVFKIIVSH